MLSKLKAALSAAWEKVKKAFVPKPAPPPPPAVQRREAREEALRSGAQARERAKLRASAVVAAKTAQDLRRAAEMARKGIPPGAVEKATAGLSPPAARAVRQAAGQLVDRRTWLTKALQWTLRQVDRPAAALRALGNVPPPVYEPGESLARKIRKYFFHPVEEVKAAARAFVHPETAPQHAVSPEQWQQARFIGPYLKKHPGAAKALTAATDILVGYLSDPLQGVGVVKAVAGGGKLVPALRVGRTTISLAKPVEKAAEAAFKATQRSEALRRLANVVRHVRYGQPEIKPGMTYSEFSRLKEAVQTAHAGMHKVRGAGLEAQAQAVREWAGRGIPRGMRSLAAEVAEARTMRAALRKLPEEARPVVQAAARAYRQSMDQVYGQLKAAFGEHAPRYLENYVFHLYKDSPQKVKAVLETWRRGKGMPGARPSFTKERVIPTLAEAKALGLRPMEDVAVLDAVYRRAAAQLMAEKELTDALGKMGFILPKRAKAAAGWVSGEEVAPWLKGKAVHPEVARVLRSGREAIGAADEAVQAALSLWDKATGLFKGVVTARPMYHIINALGNVFLLRMAGIPYHRIPALLGRALKTMAGRTHADRKILSEFRRLGGEGGVFREIRLPQQMIREAEQALAKAEGGPVRGVIRFLAPWRVLETSRGLGEFVDNVSRLAAYLHWLDEGFKPEQAVQLVRRQLFDYSALTPLERSVRRFFFPFYAWMRFAIPRSLESLITQPGTFTAYARLQDTMARLAGVGVRDFPDWLQGSIVLGTDEDDRIVVLNPQVPWADLYGFTGEERELEVTRSIGGMLHPFFRSLTGVVGGRDILTGKPLVRDEELVQHPLAMRALASLKYWLPASDIEKMRLAEISPALAPVEGALALRPSAEPAVYERYYPGLKGLFTAPVSVYDRPLAEAREAQRVSERLSTVLRQLAERGIIPQGLPKETAEKIAREPEEASRLITTEIEQEARTQTAIERAGQAWQEVLQNPTKQRVLLEMIKNARDPAGARDRILTRYSGLFLLPEEDFKKFVGWLYSPKNVYKVWVKNGRRPSAEDMLENMEWLASGGEPEAKPLRPEERARLEGAFDVPGRQPAQSASRAVETLKSMGLDRALPGAGRTFSDVVAEAIRVTGVGEDWVPYLWWLAARESSFNPSAVNPQPVGREHATGLMQTLPSTFRRYAAPGMTDITDPLHNMVAAIRYIRARYGHPSRIPNIMQWRAFRGY